MCDTRARACPSRAPRHVQLSALAVVLRFPLSPNAGESHHRSGHERELELPSMVTTRSMKSGQKSASPQGSNGEQNPEPAKRAAVPKEKKQPLPAVAVGDTNAQHKPQLRMYRGNCHCKAFVYEVELPEIKSAFECNCSICHKKGYLWVFPGDGRFEIVKGTDDTLARYTFGPEKLTHRVRIDQSP